jgi:hypothetical protein
MGAREECYIARPDPVGAERRVMGAGEECYIDRPDPVGVTP